MSLKNIKKQSFGAAGWVAGGHILSQVVRLGGNLILTRLLLPEAFGIMAIVTIFIVAMENLSDIGLKQNVIQTKTALTSRYLGTVWVVQVARGALISTCASLIALSLLFAGEVGLVGSSSVYAEKELPYLLLVMCLGPFIFGFSSVNVLVLCREMKMKWPTLVDIVSQCLGLIVMVGLAYKTQSVWSLVVGSLVVNIAKVMISYSPQLGRPIKPAFSKDHFSEIYGFGKWVFLSSILTFALTSGDRLLLGGWLTSSQMGIYSIAFVMSMAVKEVIGKLSLSVIYSLFAELNRSSPEHVASVYYRVRFYFDVLVMFLAGIFYAAGDIIIEVLYPPSFDDAGWMFEILSLSLLFVGYSFARTLLLSTGRSKDVAMLSFWVTLYLYISVPLAYSIWGIEMALYAIATVRIVEIPLTFRSLNKYGFLRLQREFLGIPFFLFGYLLFDLIDPYIEKLLGL